jgi:hypothetical protein
MNPIDPPTQDASPQPQPQVITPTAPPPAQTVFPNTPPVPVESIYPTAGSRTPPQFVNPATGQSTSDGRRTIRHGKKMLVVALALLVLLGGSAAAYIGYYVPNKPENVLAKAFSNSLQEHQFTTEGTLNLTYNDISGKADYILAANEDSHSADAKLNVTISGVNIPLELLSAKGNVYFKTGDLSPVYGLLNQFLGDDSGQAKQTEDQITKTISNQWISVDSTLIKEAKLDCLANYPQSFSQADIDSVKSSYQKSKFVTIISHAPDTVKGQATTKYVLKINDDTLAGYDLGIIPYFKNLQSCLQAVSPGTKLSLKSSKDGDTTPITVWVDKSSMKIVKYASQSTPKDKSKGVTGDLSGTISYGGVNITAPADAKPVMSLWQSLNLGDLSASFYEDGLGVVPGSGSPDVERKTDINALQGHIEAYWADEGFYPTLANLNDPSWRAANMKGLDIQTFQDPGSTSNSLSSSPAVHVYAYQTLPAKCNNTTIKCTKYTLTATLDGGGTYVKQSLN